MPVILFCQRGSDRVDIKLWNVRRAQLQCFTCRQEAWLEGFTVSDFDPAKLLTAAVCRSSSQAPKAPVQPPIQELAMSEDQITMQVRPFEKIANDSRWTGAIEVDAYVLRVGPHVYTLRTVGVGTDEKGEYALVEPYEEPFDGGLWLRLEAEPDEWSPAKPICCRVSLQRANPIYVDPNAVLRQMKIDPSSVNVLGMPPFQDVFSILFYWGGKPTEWISSGPGAPDGPVPVH